ncbi:hypothetical protein TGAMA5MH_02681 [Trichoderma gamsii]|uniref:Zn(2)-C6 fungal-type domain-containing protein n=1 Tax=Trichoderma gamsii TaxID=398673 RepID=A0A2K0TIV2_9HYPO|nr:hypothetical protein TGAMA5MH_02681 [Trichoderma gamsii]
MNACLPCRKVKMKCRLGSQPASKCERCARKSLDCVFQQHRRGRKPGTKISKRKAVELPSTDAATNQTPDYSRGTPSIVEGGPVEDPGNLQPSGVLNQEAMRGKFSLRRILSTTDGDALEPPERSLPAHLEDPIEMNILSLPIANKLFEKSVRYPLLASGSRKLICMCSFITLLNPYISQLDPYLHTFDYVRKSSFLFTTVLAVSAKTFNPAVYNALYEHAQDLYTESFRNGAKSTEIVQAILILTYWKQPQDTRAWTSVGYAIRMCMDMGWHKLTAYSAASRANADETRRREVRNVERTWLVLFVYDRRQAGPG